MSSTPYVSHTINGYSRYEIPESVAFSASAGLLYPVRVDFMNARDVRYIQAGAMIRTNPAIVPTFTPFRCSLHRFFCPLQLYHPEMRVNSANFDMQRMSTNCVVGALYGTPVSASAPISLGADTAVFGGRTLMSFLGLMSGVRCLVNNVNNADPFGSNLSTSQLKLGDGYVNADPLICYYDIVRSYYSFSQTGEVSLAYPFNSDDVGQEASLPYPRQGDTPSPTANGNNVQFGVVDAYYHQVIGKLKHMDEFYESTFYPDRGHVDGLYYNRTPELLEMIFRTTTNYVTAREQVPTIVRAWTNTYLDADVSNYFNFLVKPTVYRFPISAFWMNYLPYGVAPSVADRFSRLLPTESTPAVSLNNVTTVRGLAFASKLQTYIDLLSSGDSRFSGWLRTFFASKISHVDRPVLVYSSSFYLNSSPIFSQQGGSSLGTYAGVIEGKESFGKKAQRYSFDEPGYLIDIFCIRPLYYWAGIQRDYARYDKMDYFNPVFNQLGYEDIPGVVFGVNGSNFAPATVRRQPCYNEFRSSFDRVLGDLALSPGVTYSSRPILSAWVQQRAAISYSQDPQQVGNPTYVEKYLSSIYYTDVKQANSVFASATEDNFFVNLYYNVSAKSLVSKNFATNLATR